MQPCLGRTAGYRRQGPSQGLRPRRPDRLRRGTAGDMVAPCPDRVAPMPAAEPRPSIVLTVTAFLAVTGSFGVGLAVSMHHAAPPETVEEPVEAPPEDLMKVYYPFPQDIFITWPDRTMVIASVSFYLEGSAATLLHLQEMAKARQPELQAALLEAAQMQAEASADIPAYRADLPAALRARVNTLLGDEAMPEPVKDVLLTKFMAR